MSIAPIVYYIENELFRFYNLESSISAIDFITTNQQIYQDLGIVTENIPSTGEVFLLNDDKLSEELNLCIYFNKDILDRLKYLNPLKQLTMNNLNDLWIVTEELSHFHLIIQRYQKKSSTTKIELEWQAEIDKIIIPSTLLLKQNGFNQIQDLFLLSSLYTKFISKDPIYKKAKYFSEKFWLKFLPAINNHNCPTRNSYLKENLRVIYDKSWQEKITFLIA